LMNRIPPQNIEAEEAILGGILQDPFAITRVMGLLPSPKVFLHSAHQKIYQVCSDLHRQGKGTDLMLVATELNDRTWLEGVGGQSKLTQLVDRTVSSVNIDQYAALICDKWFKRQIMSICQKTIEEGYTPGSSSELLENLAGEVQKLRDSMAPVDCTEQISDIIPKVYLEMKKEAEGEAESSVKTGYYDIDRDGGLLKGCMTVVAARAGMGKSTFASNIAHNVAAKGGTVVVFSLEMTKPQLTKKLLSLASGIEANKLHQPKSLLDSEWESLANIGCQLDLPMWFDERSNPSILDIRNSLRSIQEFCPSDKPLKLVIVDYVGLMGESLETNRVRELDVLLKQLSAIAKDFGIAVLGLAQINRSVEGRQDKRPTLADIRESGGYEQQAAKVLALYNDAYYNPNSSDKGIIEVLVLKSRFSESGQTIKLGFKPEIGKLYNLRT
jgi:replicative DNA helicase